MEHEASYWIFKIFAWTAFWMIAYEAIAANKRQGG